MWLQQRLGLPLRAMCLLPVSLLLLSKRLQLHRWLMVPSCKIM
jgi:hypothetical protein